jgi:predicted alpha/beta-hydrolase family hydrolase
VRVPCLFVSGTRDPFGTPDELAAATAAVGGPVTTHLVEGGGHDLKRADARVAGVVAEWVAGLGS